MKPLRKSILLLLLFVVLCFPAIASAATLHGILAGDTHDPAIGQGVAKDIENMSTLLRTASNHANMEFNLITLVGEQITTSNINNAIRNLSVGPDDAVVFYYSGHGYRWSSTSERWPLLSLRDGGLEEYQIFNSIRAKSPRFTLTMSDSCNSYADGAPRGEAIIKRSVTKEIDIAENYRNLFRNYSGAIISSSSLPGQTSTGYTIGGAYTLQFLEVFDTAIRSINLPTWQSIMEQANRPVSDHQPQFQLFDLIHHGDTSTTTPIADSNDTSTNPPTPAPTNPNPPTTTTPIASQSDSGQQPAQQGEGEVVAVITNISGYDFHELYCSPSNADFWGENLISEEHPLSGINEVLIPSYFINSYGECVYDIYAVDIDGDPYYKWQINLCDADVIEFSLQDLNRGVSQSPASAYPDASVPIQYEQTPAQAGSTSENNMAAQAEQELGFSPFIFINNETGITMYYAYCSPSSYSEWGPDIFGSTTLSAGDSFYFNTGEVYGAECTYDIKIIDQEGTTYTFIGVDICNNPELTVTTANRD